MKRILVLGSLNIDLANGARRRDKKVCHSGPQTDGHRSRVAAKCRSITTLVACASPSNTHRVDCCPRVNGGLKVALNAHVGSVRFWKTAVSPLHTGSGWSATQKPCSHEDV